MGSLDWQLPGSEKGFIVKALTRFTSAYRLQIWKESANCSGPANYIYAFDSDGDYDRSDRGGYSVKYDSDAGFQKAKSSKERPSKYSS